MPRLRRNTKRQRNVISGWHKSFTVRHSGRFGFLDTSIDLSIPSALSYSFPDKFVAAEKKYLSRNRGLICQRHCRIEVNKFRGSIKLKRIKLCCVNASWIQRYSNDLKKWGMHRRKKSSNRHIFLKRRSSEIKQRVSNLDNPFTESESG